MDRQQPAPKPEPVAPEDPSSAEDEEDESDVFHLSEDQTVQDSGVGSSSERASVR